MALLGAIISSGFPQNSRAENVMLQRTILMRRHA
jgi:hypothetical protein